MDSWMLFRQLKGKQKGLCFSLSLSLMIASILCTVPAGAALINPQINPGDLIGTLSVTTIPAGADVSIDGVFSGRTPLSRGLAIGTHTLLLKSTGYHDHTQQVVINSGSTTNINVRMIAVIPTGTLVLDSVPPSASIFVDSVAKGTTPLTAQNVRTGTYSITLKLEGYEDTTKEVTVSEGQTTKFSPVLQPAAAGMISVNSIPAGASVYLDGEARGETPLTIRGVRAGQHTIKLALIGYEEHSVPVTVAAGGSLPLMFNLEKTESEPDPGPGATGSIAVSSVPAGADVLLDGESKGNTPITLSGVPAGSHTVKMRLAGYADFSAALTVEAGQGTSVQKQLVKTGQDSKRGSLSITSNLPDAVVYINGMEIGRTPLTVPDQDPGYYQIMLKHEIGIPETKTVTVKAGEMTEVHVDMGLVYRDPGPLPKNSGSITATSLPSGANVYLDGDFRGTTPLTITNVAAGSHNLLLTMPGYLDARETVQVETGSTVQVSVTMSGGKKAPGFSLFSTIAALITGLLFLSPHAWQRIRMINLTGSFPEQAEIVRIQKNRNFRKR
jgi:hypothetical protein